MNGPRFVRRVVHRLPSNGAVCIALATVLFVSAAQPLSAQGADGATPVPAGAVIRKILIVPQPIFDERLPGERTDLFRLANRLHVDTHSEVIRAQLLFKEGDPYSDRVMRETERSLRKLHFLREPDIRVVAVSGNSVDVEVRTSDVWTLAPTFEFRRSGGSNRSSVGLQDFNFLGTGKSLEVSHKSDRDRTRNVLAYNDPNVQGSRWKFDLELSDNSDGHAYSAALERPFFALDSKNSYGIAVADVDLLERRYSLGEVVDVYGSHRRRADAFVGFSEGLVGGWTFRHSLGLRLDEARFDAIAPDLGTLPPHDRRFVYPYYQFEAVEDDFSTITNRDRIGRTEDESYGWRWFAEIGLASSGLGSDRNAALVRTEVSDGVRLNSQQSLFLRAGYSARRESAGLVDELTSFGARYFFRQSAHSTFYAGFSADIGDRLDADHDLLIGGDMGLRAYPFAFQSGEKRALLTVEQRYFSDFQIFHTFSVGAAVFADVGRVWAPSSIDATNLGTLKDVGLGLRIGNLRSARSNILHVDLAWPLDDPFASGPQLMIETRTSF